MPDGEKKKGGEKAKEGKMKIKIQTGERFENERWKKKDAGQKHINLIFF